MVNKKISELTELTTSASDDVLAIVDTSETETKKIQKNNLVPDKLTDNSMADTLHRHSELSASDGTPDAVFAIDADGNVRFFDSGNDPTFSIGDSGSGGNFGFLRWVSATDTLNLGTTVGGTWNDQITLLESGNVGIGVIDPHSKLEVAGAISSATATITEDTADLDVSGINVLFVNPGAATSITGFTNGVAGQVLYISAVANGQDITMVHNSGTQKVFLHTGADETLSSEFGGWTLTCDGSNWYDTEHSKHV